MPTKDFLKEKLFNTQSPYKNPNPSDYKAYYEYENSEPGLRVPRSEQARADHIRLFGDQFINSTPTAFENGLYRNRQYQRISDRPRSLFRNTPNPEFAKNPLGLRIPTTVNPQNVVLK